MLIASKRKDATMSALQPGQKFPLITAAKQSVNEYIVVTEPNAVASHTPPRHSNEGEGDNWMPH